MARIKGVYYRNRVQVFNPKSSKWVKIDTSTGKMMGTKKDGQPYKSIRPHRRRW